MSEIDFAKCPDPDCQYAASVEVIATSSSTHGPVVVVRTRCLAEPPHIFRGDRDGLIR